MYRGMAKTAREQGFDEIVVRAEKLGRSIMDTATSVVVIDAAALEVLHAEGASAFEIMKAGAWRDHRSVFRYTSVDVRQVRATINKIRI